MNSYVKKPFSIAQYTMMRGTIDFTNAGQFNLYEKGYQFFIVLTRPKYMEMLAEQDPEVAASLNLFCWILENEFKGLDGIDNITTDPLEYTDNISTLSTIGKVNMPSTVEISSQYTERSGSALTGFLDYYLRGIKAPRTQAKTYHGLIKEGKLAGGFENEVFDFLYMVTDNTMLSLEKAFLFSNAWFNTVPLNIYNGEKGSIEPAAVDLSFTCFLIDGEEVDKRALRVLSYINENNAVANANTVNGSSKATVAVASEVKSYAKDQIHPDSESYKYKGFDKIESYYSDAVTQNTQSTI